MGAFIDCSYERCDIPATGRLHHAQPQLRLMWRGHHRGCTIALLGVPDC